MKFLNGTINLKINLIKKMKNLKFQNENNFLIKQYIADKKMKIKHNYLSEQFKSQKKYLN